MRNRDIHQALQAFTLAKLQSFRTMLITLEQNGLTINQALRYIWFRTLNVELASVKPCPECDSTLTLFAVNQTACTHVGGKDKSQWYCSHCGYAEFSRKTVLQERHKLITRLYPFVAEKKKYEKEMLKWEVAEYLERPIPAPCPDCKKTMYLNSISTPMGKANLHGYKTLWFCDHCGYEKYSINSITEEATRLRRI